MVYSGNCRFVKPLKRSQKARLRKRIAELKKKQEANPKWSMVDPATYGLTWEQIKEMKF